MKVVQIINEVGINDKYGGYLRLIPLVLLLVPPTLPLVPPGGTHVFPCSHLSLSSAPLPIPVWPVLFAGSTLDATLGPRGSTWSTSAGITPRIFPSSLFRFLPSTHRLSAATAAVVSAPVRQVSPSTRPPTSRAGASLAFRRLHLSPAPQSSLLLSPTYPPLFLTPHSLSAPPAMMSSWPSLVPGSSPSIAHGATPFSLLPSVSSALSTSTAPVLLKVPLWLSTSFPVSSGPSFFLGRCPSPTSSTPFCGIPSSPMTADFPPPFLPPLSPSRMSSSLHAPGLRPTLACRNQAHSQDGASPTRASDRRRHAIRRTTAGPHRPRYR